MSTCWSKKVYGAKGNSALLTGGDGHLGMLRRCKKDANTSDCESAGIKPEGSPYPLTEPC